MSDRCPAASYSTVSGMKALFRVCIVLTIALLGGVVLAACGGDDAPDRPGESLPAGFPVDDVPLVDGAVLSPSGDDQSWRFSIQANAAEGNPLTAATKKLEDAGYEESSRAGDPANQTVTLWKDVGDDTLWVSVGVSADASGGGSSLFYQVERVDKKPK